MKLPRDLGGPDLIKALRSLGYVQTRQRGSLIRVTTLPNGEHHKVVPNQSPIAIGTLRPIQKSIAAHHKLTSDELVDKLDL